MVNKTNSILLWIFAVIFTVSTAIYQRLTGPTHPQRVNISMKGESYTFKLLRSHGGDDDAEIKLEFPENFKGIVEYKRYKMDEEWTTVPMTRDGESGIAKLPHQPPAGKLEYLITIIDGADKYQLIEEPVVIRFKGAVASYVLIPHIFFMFMAMLFSLRTGLEALFKGDRTLKYARFTLISLGVGGLVLGPIVQWMAFGDFWTGWPFGGDWTDNKTIIGWGFWLIAYLVLRKKPMNKIWPIIAFVVLFAMYMIPHSMGGSEFDYEKGKVETGTRE